MSPPPPSRTPGFLKLGLGVVLLYVVGWSLLQWLVKPYDGVHAPPPAAPLEVTPYAPPEGAGPSPAAPPPWDDAAPPPDQPPVDPEAAPKEAFPPTPGEPPPPAG